MPPTQFLTTEQVAQLLHRQPESVAALARTKALTGLRDGKRWLFDPRDVEAYLQTRREASGHTPPARRRPRRTR